MKKKKQKCGYKRRFRDKDEALHGLRLIQTADPPREKTPTRAYLCPRCKGWHLTSKPLSGEPEEGEQNTS